MTLYINGTKVVNSLVIDGDTGGGVTPTFSSTTLVDNSSAANSFTFSDDYHNYDFVKFKILYTGTNRNYYFLTTPSSIDLVFNISSYINFNVPNTNRYCCYSQSSLTWTRYNKRDCDITEIIGLKCTNATVTETEIYKATSYSSSNIDVTTQLDLFDFDLILFTANSGDRTEVQPNINVLQCDYGMIDVLWLRFYPYYSAADVSITNHYISASKYAYIIGIKFT